MAKLPSFTDAPFRFSQARPTHVRATFDSVSYATVVPLPFINGEHLSDVQLAIHGELPHYDATEARPANCCHDIRLGLCVNAGTERAYYDITPALCGAIGDAIDSCDPAVIATQYRDGMSRWFAWLSVLGIRHDGSDAAKVVDEQLHRYDKLSRHIEKLGDRQAGPHGSLHIFNYLYSHIRIPPVSLAHVLERADIPRTDHNSVLNGDPAFLIVSHGTDHPYAENPASPAVRASGSLSLYITAIVTNPLAEIVVDLRDTIRRRLLAIHEALKPGGELQDALLDINDRLMHLDQTCDAVSALLDEQRANVAEVRTELAGLKAQVGKLS